MMRHIYNITVELDDYPESLKEPAAYLGVPLTDNKAADLVRDLFYRHSDRHFSQIHASVVFEIVPNAHSKAENDPIP